MKILKEGDWEIKLQEVIEGCKMTLYNSVDRKTTVENHASEVECLKSFVKIAGLDEGARPTHTLIEVPEKDIYVKDVPLISFLMVGVLLALTTGK